MEEQKLSLKVYLEDTDAQGIVYHADYLKYFERARSEILEGQGYKLQDLTRSGKRFLVHEMQIKYHHPALLGDRLEVRSSVHRTSEYRLAFHQTLHRSAEPTPLVSVEVQVVCVDQNGSLIELPNDVFPND